MSEPSASSTLAQGTISESTPTGGKQDKPLTLSAPRQQNAAAVQQLVAISSRLKVAIGRIDSQQLTIAKLQAWDEENKQIINGLTLRIESCKKSNDVLWATLEMITKTLGIDLSQSSRTSDSADARAPNQTSNLTEEEEGDVVRIVKAALLQLYGIPKFNPRDHGMYPTVSKEHMDWPHTYDGGRRVRSHQSNLGKDYTYSSPCNNDSFQAWMDLLLKQGAVLIGCTKLPPRVLNQNTVSKQCIAHFRYLQRRVQDYLKDLAPVSSIKRRGEGLDEPMAGELLDFMVVDTAGASGLSDGGMGIDAPLLFGPANKPVATPREGVAVLALPATETKDVKPLIGKRDPTQTPP